MVFPQKKLNYLIKNYSNYIYSFTPMEKSRIYEYMITANFKYLTTGP